MNVSPATISERLTTCGDYAVESDAEAALDAVLARHERNVLVFREVEGHYIQPRLSTPAKTPRIDRILLPRPPVVAAGWKAGPVGIEVKKSGTKAGPALAQCMDYSRAAFILPDRASCCRVLLEWTFIFPVKDILCDIASITVQNRIGNAFLRNGDLNLYVGGATALIFRTDGSFFVRQPQCGDKVGCR